MKGKENLFDLKELNEKAKKYFSKYKKKLKMEEKEDVISSIILALIEAKKTYDSEELFEEHEEKIVKKTLKKYSNSSTSHFVQRKECTGPCEKLLLKEEFERTLNLAVNILPSLKLKTFLYYISGYDKEEIARTCIVATSKVEKLTKKLCTLLKEALQEEISYEEVYDIRYNPNEIIVTSIIEKKSKKATTFEELYNFIKQENTILKNHRELAQKVSQIQKSKAEKWILSGISEFSSKELRSKYNCLSPKDMSSLIGLLRRQQRIVWKGEAKYEVLKD